MNDQIADLLVRIRNSVAVGKFEIILPFSKMKEVILELLKKEGFVKEIRILQKKNQKMLKIDIASQKAPKHLRQLSKPGQRIYVRSKEIPKPLRGFGLIIISTPKGVITGREASKKGVGGELICEVW